MLKKRIYILLSLVKATLLFNVAFSYGQTINVKKIKQLEVYKESKKANSNKLTKIENQKLLLKAKYNYDLANRNINNNKDDVAFTNYMTSREQYKKLDSIDKVALIDIKIVSLLLALKNINLDYSQFLKEYIEYAKQKNNPNYLSQAYMEIGKSFYDTNPQMALTYFKKAEIEILKTNDEIFHGRILQNIGATYAHDDINKNDSALYVYKKALKIFKKHNLPLYIFNIYTNSGKAYWKKKDNTTALYYYKKADSIPLKEFRQKNKEILYGFMADAYKSMGDYKKTIEYIEKQNVFKNILDEKQQEIAIKEINVKYTTEKKELENASLKNKLQTNRIIILIGLGLLIISITISILAYKNIAKKKKIVEQEKLLQTEKFITTLKEQELKEIDIMLESQEKERQRIANELHDNLGSILATLKFNFQNIAQQEPLKNPTVDLLFKKTDSLLEEAYQEVRNISHLKNLGVVGNQGLEVSVKNMAEKMSVKDKILFNVIPYGLSERLENNKEIILFRMIQELCTNIIKHSQANEVNIYLTQHDNAEINIIIEDNGIGFNPKENIKKEGIGLKNIEKKVEQMNGTFTIDSILNKGTTIIIDLPL